MMLVIAVGCGKKDEGPTQEEIYRKAVSDFYVSLAAGQTDEARFAFNKMNDVARAFPEEPAAWANLGVFAMRQGNFDLAEDRFARALELASENEDVLFLAALMESRRGRVNASVAHLEKGVGLHPHNPRMRWFYVQELERQDATANEGLIRDNILKLRETLPDNQMVLYEKARIAVRNRDAQMLDNALEGLAGFVSGWPAEAVSEFRGIRRMAADGDFASLSLEIAFLRSGIEHLPGFQGDRLRLELPPNDIGYLIPGFIVLPMPEYHTAPVDTEIRFASQVPEGFPQAVQLAKQATLLENLPPLPIHITQNRLHIGDDVVLDFPGNTEGRLPSAAIAEVDFNYNFRNDIALAGNLGFRLYAQDDDMDFQDVTARTGLPNTVINAPAHGVWAADIDLDGDLDLVYAPVGGSPLVFRNNSDDTFSVLRLFDAATDVVDMLYADLNNTGAADILFLDKNGNVHLFYNLRGNRFAKAGFPESPAPVAAIQAADITGNGQFDVIAVDRSGNIHLAEFHVSIQGWSMEKLLEAETNGNGLEPGKTRLFVADMDNNGGFDIILSSPKKTMIWLRDKDAGFIRYGRELPGRATSIFDIDGNDRLDILGAGSDGAPFQLMNSGSKPYFAYSVRARASGLEGDQRINSFGIGGEMEVRAGLLYQKQRIVSPILHFGLGELEEPDMLRIIWPNGSTQAEFTELGLGSTIFNEQVLKGSCPWLFTNDGEEIHFITDILWRSPLGLRINALETAGVIQTLDRVRVPGDKLRPVNGKYDLRVTAELWETHFFDYVSLIAVDHPQNTEVFIDERFVFPAPDLSARVFSSPRAVQKVTDMHGKDVTDLVRSNDGRYLKPFVKTSYQGLVEDHFIEIDLGGDVPNDEPVWLILHGWLRPTDSSINLALSQGSHVPPSGMRVYVSDGKGGWELHDGNFGIPAGKLKTVLLDLEGAFDGVDERKVRIHTTSEIYWDSIKWAVHLPEAAIVKREAVPVRQELRFRGYSEWDRADAVSPKLPEYGTISGTTPRWRDLEGFHTRFGDVSELLSDIDDRYVIMNAGDEMVLEFEALPETEPGHSRTFIFVSDGWVKDGDYNTEASKTVLPLPYHGMTDYEYDRHTGLTDDPVYKKHREDWANFHTRYINTKAFRKALIFAPDAVNIP